LDKNFPYVSLIVPKANLCDNQSWIDNFINNELMSKNAEVEHKPHDIPPIDNNKANDHN
jgi:hypothetical protein